jgi:predicted nucleic acid-binding protein
MKSLPLRLGSGEAEAIAICHNQKMVFVTHDRKAANYCDRAGISVVRMKELLEAFQRTGLINAADAQKMLS